MRQRAISREGIVSAEREDTFIRRFKRILHIPAMKTTLRTLFRVPQVNLYHPIREHSQYPYIAARYRGLLALSKEACTGCKKCERICPNKVIIMRDIEIEGDTYRFPAYFAGRCMKCGLCEEVCDRQYAIRHTDQWEDAGYIREQLYYSPERMWDMWDKHIQPRIDAKIAHVAVPDKKKIKGDKDTQKAKEKEVMEFRKQQDAAEPTFW